MAKVLRFLGLYLRALLPYKKGAAAAPAAKYAAGFMMRARVAAAAAAADPAVAEVGGTKNGGVPDPTTVLSANISPNE